MCKNRLSCTITDNTQSGAQIRLINTNIWQGELSNSFKQPLDISSDPGNPSVNQKIFQYCGSKDSEPGITGIITYAINDSYNLVFSFNIPKHQNLLDGGNSTPFFYASIVPVNSSATGAPICIAGMYIVQNAKDPGNPGGPDDLLFDADSGVSIFSLDVFITLGNTLITNLISGPDMGCGEVNDYPFWPAAATTINIVNKTEGIITFNSLDFLNPKKHSDFAPSGMPPDVNPTILPNDDTSLLTTYYGILKQFSSLTGDYVYAPYAPTQGNATFNMPNGTLLTINWNLEMQYDTNDKSVKVPTIEADTFYAIEGRDNPELSWTTIRDGSAVSCFPTYTFNLVISDNG